MINENAKIYRRRFIPNEKILLKDDEVIYIDDSIIVTKWKALRPRRDFDHGCSCYYLNKGIKISKFYTVSGKLLYYYCDIIETLRNEEENAYVFNDLLADVVIYEDGFVKVLDIGEIAHAMDKRLITIQQAKKSLATLDELLNIVYSGRLKQLTCVFDKYSL